MELVSAAAFAENRVINRDDEFPWPSIPADKKQYRGHVADDLVVFGRTIFRSTRDNLPGSVQIVISRSERSFSVDTAHRAASIEEAVDITASLDTKMAYVIGGATIYALFQPHLDRMVLSRVPGEYKGDIYYPEWDVAEWGLDVETDHEGFTLQEWVRLASFRQSAASKFVRLR